jgi:hypothetical protein
MYRERARDDDRAIVNARARLEWEHAPDAVQSELLRSGFPPSQAASIVRDFQVERAASERRKYERIGVASVALVAVGWVLILLNVFVRSRIGSSDVGRVEFVIEYLFDGLGFLLGTFAVFAGLVGSIYGLANWVHVFKSKRQNR